MVIDIVKDIKKLEKPLLKVEQGEDIQYIIRDLIDTGLEHDKNCLGMAANQIGYEKRIIIAKLNGIESAFTVMINPVIIKQSGKKYVSTESCLSLDGARKTMRISNVTVAFRDRSGKVQTLSCKGLVAKVVQHEIDHCNGIII